MIKANELRIGNYVSVNNEKYYNEITGKILQVSGIKERVSEHFPDSDYVVSMTIGLESFSQFEEFLTPIPLTDEWLVKFGFEDDAGYEENGNIPKVLSTEHGQILIYPDGVYLSDYFIIVKAFVKIEFLHHLQNFVYYLTGEELTIKN